RRTECVPWCPPGHCVASPRSVLVTVRDARGRGLRLPCGSLAVRDDEPVNAGPRLEFRLLGRFAVLRGGVEIPPAAFGGRKARTLLRVLATRRGELVSTDALTEALWPDRAPADPAANL